MEGKKKGYNIKYLIT